MAVESPHGFVANPYAEDVETTFVAYECGWAVFAPIDECEQAPDERPICWAGRADP